MKYPVGEWFKGLKGTKIYIIDKDNYKYICQTCGREIEGGMFDVCYYNVVKTVKNCSGCGVGILPRKKWLKNTLGTKFIIHDCHNFEYICKTCGKKIKRRGNLYNSAENCMECYQSNNAVKTYNKYKFTLTDSEKPYTIYKLSQVTGIPYDTIRYRYQKLGMPKKLDLDLIVNYRRRNEKELIRG